MKLISQYERKGVKSESLKIGKLSKLIFTAPLISKELYTEDLWVQFSSTSVDLTR